MANEPTKVLTEEGLKVLWNQISLDDYPNNDLLIAALDAIDATKADKDEIVKYSLSKDGINITLEGTDNSVSVIQESTTNAIDDNAGNVVLTSTDAINSINESLKQELVNATMAALPSETLTFVLMDGTTVTKEVVVKV